MNCFKLPKGICDEINTTLARFWWRKGNQRGMHWLNWKRLCLPKREGGLGFRDIEKFNKALLGKQVWRLMTNPNSLASRLLRQRYHPNSSIIDSDLGTKPSFLWRSFQEGKELLKKGLRCIVGDGTQIDLWKDPWLDTNPPRPPKFRDGVSTTFQRVADLMLPNNQGWNTELLENTVDAQDIPEIMKIKLNSFDSDDLIGWQYNRNGVYSVKSGYWLATHLDQSDVHPPEGSITLKQKIWSLSTAPKIKHFLWRLLSQTLAVGNILQARGITNNIQCRRCCIAEESLDHLFFTCPYAIAVWRAIDVHPNIFTNSTASFVHKIQYIVERAKQLELDSFQQQIPLWGLWRLWKSRNQLYFQSRNVEWHQSKQAILNDTREWLLVNDHVSKREQCSSNYQAFKQSCWQRPQIGFIKCNYDCSYIDNTRDAKAGWIIRDEAGVFLEAGSRTGKVCKSILEAEFQALLMAMQHVWIKGHTHVVFEGDNQVLYNLLHGKLKDFQLYVWLKEIWHWTNRFTEVTFNWTKRHGNKIADVLARNHEENTLFKHYNLAPICINSLLFDDHVASLH